MVVPTEDLRLRFRIGIVASEKAVEVSIRAPEETDIGAVVASEAFAIKLITKVATGHGVDKGIAQAFSGSIDILTLCLIEVEVS